MDTVTGSEEQVIQEIHRIVEELCSLPGGVREKSLSQIKIGITGRDSCVRFISPFIFHYIGTLYGGIEAVEYAQQEQGPIVTTKFTKFFGRIPLSRLNSLAPTRCDVLIYKNRFYELNVEKGERYIGLARELRGKLENLVSLRGY